MKKIIRYIKFLLNQKRFSEILDRKTIIFLHIPKVGGSSFWHSLAKAASNNCDIGIRDSYAEMLTLARTNSDDAQNKALLLIKKAFDESNKKRLIMHHHSPVGHLKEFFPDAGFIFMIRSPLDRLRSAFRHLMQLSSNKVFDVVQNKIISYDHINRPLDFFESNFLPGINYFFTGLFDDSIDPLTPPPLNTIHFMRQNFLFFTLDDFRSNNHKIKLIEKNLSISSIEVIQFKGTITDNKFDNELVFLLENNKEFSLKWNQFLHAETSWNKALGLDV
jgi:hypothetical protein